MNRRKKELKAETNKKSNKLNKQDNNACACVVL